MSERCELCGCAIHRSGGYATPTVQGRSHATEHHYVAERFFGRSKNRPGEQRDPIFDRDPWRAEGKAGVFCYECHEELLHNPVFLPEDMGQFAKLVSLRGFSEEEKSVDRSRIAGRIELLHEVIHRGLSVLIQEHRG